MYFNTYIIFVNRLKKIISLKGYRFLNLYWRKKQMSFKSVPDTFNKISNSVNEYIWLFLMGDMTTAVNKNQS